MAVTEPEPEGQAPGGRSIGAGGAPEDAGVGGEALAGVSGRPAGESVLRRQPPRESAARTYARALPIVPVRARGLTIEGADGRRYLDCLSGGTLALGHNHPVVLQAIRNVLDSGAPLHAPDLATPVRDAFVTELLHTLPPGLADHARVRFCGPTAADAVAATLGLVRAATGRSRILRFTDTCHDLSAGSLDAGTGPGAGADAHAEVGAGVGVPRPPRPQDDRCPFGMGDERGLELAARWAESALDDSGPGRQPPAGVILEAVQGAAGVVPAPGAWLRRIRQITADRSVPLIADEVQTGVGRTGAFWAVEHSGIVPDVMVLSQAIGGSLPLSVIVHHEDLDVWAPGVHDVWAPGVHASTSRGNQLAMAAGTATLAYVRTHGLAGRAAVLGARMLDQLRALARGFPCVGEVRGRGLMIGVEMAAPAGPRDRSTRRWGGRAGGDASGIGGASELIGGAMPDLGPPAHASRALPESVGPRPLAESVGRPHATASEPAAAVQHECLERGLIVDRCPGHSGVVRLLPPLTITDEQADALLDRLADALEAVARALP
ncbi:aminotransferase class III-fold pyridoxal phosphate-dependent enzyme [Streptomyces sp. NPDC102395]|uniref:aminotransferase class III-fold pyridoxal phosphate-dependent enzyme n=1 Tax=Streptomyces sp. NPDC102395 TaxID=3366168 RepID=UPI003821439D